TLVSATVFLSTDPPPTAIYTLSLHDALPICDRLTVNDIWRVVLFVKTIPNKTLRKNYVPQPSDYITWQPSKELLAWVKSSQKLENNVGFNNAPVTDPFMQEAMRVMPGLSTGDSFLINDGKTRLSLQDAA